MQVKQKENDELVAQEDFVKLSLMMAREKHMLARKSLPKCMKDFDTEIVLYDSAIEELAPVRKMRIFANLGASG